MSITDAVGHQVAAALLATLLVGALRNARRRGMDLAEQARYANESPCRERRRRPVRHRQLLQVDLRTETAVIVNAGHTCPLRLRDGRVEEVELIIEPPFGVVPGRLLPRAGVPARAGRPALFLTDGMLERNAASLDVAAALADSADLHPREVVHALGAAVLRATGGDLLDDATMVCLDWYGGPPRARTPSSAPIPPAPRAAH